MQICYLFPDLQKPFSSMQISLLKEEKQTQDNISFFNSLSLSFFFVFLPESEKEHTAVGVHSCCGKGRRKDRKRNHSPRLHYHVHILTQKKINSLLVRQGAQTRRFLTATGRQVQSIMPPANPRSDTCTCKKVHRCLVFNQFRSNLSIKGKKKQKCWWAGGGGVCRNFLPNVSI